MKIAFLMGALMIGWDWLGHLCCALCRMTGPTGARIWNTYSANIWPSISNSLHYDLFWSAWHGVALSLMTWAFIDALRAMRGEG